MPHFVAELVDVLVRRLLALSSHLHHVVRVCLNKCFCREETEI